MRRLPLDLLTSESDIVVVLQSVDSIKLTTDIELFCGVVQVLYSWVILITAENLLGLLGPKGILLEGKAEVGACSAYLSGL